MARFLSICMGGAIGTGARYLMTVGAIALFGPVFPWGTIAVNVIGSFFIGVVMQAALSAKTISPDLRLFLTVGILGGFTTYSSFNYETLRLVREGSWGLAGANFALTTVACFLAGFAGVALVERLAASPAAI